MNNETLDSGAVNLAKAIRQTETGGDFTARGKSGEFGAYQFTKPTWDTYAKKFGVNAQLEHATPEQQNEVAYKQIKEWKDQGYNVGQIASLWNSGKPDAYKDKNYKGKNKYGVTYDVPAYAESVATAYQKLKEGTPVQADPNNPSSTANTTPVEPPETTGQKVVHGVEGIISSITDPISQLGGGLMNLAGGAGAALGHMLGGQGNFAPQKTVEGVTGNQVDSAGYRAGQELGAGQTAKQVTGDIAQGLANFVLPGEGALAAQGIKQGLLRASYQGAKTFGKYGALTGAGEALQEGESLPNTLKRSVQGGLTSGALGLGLGVAGGGLAKIGRGIADTGIFGGLEGVGQKAKEKYAQTVESQLGKHAKGVGETMFDYGVGHNQTGNDAAYQIRNEIANKAEESLTEILKGKNHYTPVKTWLEDSLANIKSGTGTYGAIKNYIENHIADVIEHDPKYKGLAVENAQGGVSLPDWALNELKQQNWVNSKFSITGDPSATIKAEANQAMGRAGRAIIERNTEGINVGDYNKELGRLYKAADILEKKGDKPVFSDKSNHFISQILGGLVGSHGGLISTLLYAKTAESVAAQLSKTPMFLRKTIAEKFAEKGKSQLFDEAIELLNKMERDKASQLALPAPSFVPMRAPRPEPNLKVLQAKRGLVGTDPKTKKFMKTYTSEGTEIPKTQKPGVLNKRFYLK